jgi:hypothetical protein
MSLLQFKHSDKNFNIIRIISCCLGTGLSSHGFCSTGVLPSGMYMGTDVISSDCINQLKLDLIKVRGTLHP